MSDYRAAIASTPEPVVSIILVNSDTLDLTLQCIASIYENLPSHPCEIVLVDNCSQDACVAVVQRLYPQVQCYSAPHRQGFSRNYNLGMRNARGRYVLILNNDTIVHPRAIDILVQALEDIPTYGLVGPRLMSPNGRIQPASAVPLPTLGSYIARELLFDAGLPLGRLRNRIREWSLARRASGPVPGISGACMATAQAHIGRVGLLDEEFDFYYEDIEWCHRFQKFGLDVAYIAEAHITHLGNQSLSKVKIWAKQAEYRSAIRYFRKYRMLSCRQERLLWLATVLSYVLRAAIFSMIGFVSGKDEHGLAYRSLLKWIWSQVPAMNRTHL